MATPGFTLTVRELRRLRLPAGTLVLFEIVELAGQPGGRFSVWLPRRRRKMGWREDAKAAAEKDLRSRDTDADQSARFSTDGYLRAHGFTIAERPREGTPIWARGGRTYTQREAVGQARREDAKRGGTNQ